MKLFYFLILAFAAACGPATPLNSSDTDKNVHDVTDTSACLGSPTKMNIYSTWRKHYAGDSGTYEVTYQINATNSTRITRTCYFPSGAAVQTLIDVPSFVQGSLYSITRGDQHTETQTINGASYTCSVSVTPTQIQFAFSGNCLAFIANGKTDYMIP